MKHHYLTRMSVVTVLMCVGGLLVNGDTSKESKISTINVPYLANSVYYPYPFTKANRGRKVMVPVEMDIVPSLYLSRKSKSFQAPLVNFFDGAYPVFYTAGHANGHFNGRISILEK